MRRTFIRVSVGTVVVALAAAAATSAFAASTARGHHFVLRGFGIMGGPGFGGPGFGGPGFGGPRGGGILARWESAGDCQRLSRTACEVMVHSDLDAGSNSDRCVRWPALSSIQPRWETNCPNRR